MLRRPFEDLDLAIARREGLGISEIFSMRGEAGFREIEASALRELLAGGDAPGVLSLGGGTPMYGKSLEALEEYGAFCIYLRGTADTLRSHLKGEAVRSRPMLHRGRMDELLAERVPVYEEVADMVLDIDGLSVMQIAQVLAAELESRMDSKGGTSTT